MSNKWLPPCHPRRCAPGLESEINRKDKIVVDSLSDDGAVRPRNASNERFRRDRCATGIRSGKVAVIYWIFPARSMGNGGAKRPRRRRDLIRCRGAVFCPPGKTPAPALSLQATSHPPHAGAGGATTRVSTNFPRRTGFRRSGWCRCCRAGRRPCPCYK